MLEIELPISKPRSPGWELAKRDLKDAWEVAKEQHAEIKNLKDRLRDMCRSHRSANLLFFLASLVSAELEMREFDQENS